MIVNVFVAGAIVPSSGAFTVARNPPFASAGPVSAICSPDSVIGAEAPKPLPPICMVWVST